MISPEDWQAVSLTLKLAVLSTVALITLALPLAWWLSKKESLTRHLVQSITTLPLVLPPTVLGFYLLLLLGSQGPLIKMGLPVLAFNFWGLLIGSVVYSFPFAIQPLIQAFKALPWQYPENAKMLGMSEWRYFTQVALPHSRRALATSIILAFAHTLGEFGVVLMIGGNIPGQTRVLSIAIYDHVESFQYSQAHSLSLGLVLSSIVILMAVFALNRPKKAIATGAGNR